MIIMHFSVQEEDVIEHITNGECRVLEFLYASRNVFSSILVPSVICI
jgi:hypothetical protein